jgi:DnaJ-class molecular chaperone
MTTEPDDTVVGEEEAPDTKAGGPAVCTECGGTGRVGPELCSACAGRGDVEESAQGE